MIAPDDYQQLKNLYGRLCGISETIDQYVVPLAIVDDFNNLIISIANILKCDLNSLRVTNLKNYNDGESFAEPREFKPKVMQLKRLLELGHNINENIIQIGSIYNSIAEEELKRRCADILSATGEFDRVINQATLVLEDRIRSKSGLANNLVGVALINQAINPEPKKSILIIQGDSVEHEGIHYICKGIMLAFRHQTHHRLTDKFGREDALKVCAFIDNILQIIDKADRN